jgi:hypothetical protein
VGKVTVSVLIILQFMKAKETVAELNILHGILVRQPDGVWENTVLRRIFGAQADEIRGG